MASPTPSVNDGRSRRLRKGMYILPSLFTTANLAAGFYAITQAALGAAHAEGLIGTPGVDPLRTAAIYLNHSAIAIGFAVFFDGMDGAIARLTHTTSDFGKELDSLADVVTFGVAPGILAWIWGFFFLPYTFDADLRRKLVECGAIVAFAFLTPVPAAWRASTFSSIRSPRILAALAASISSACPYPEAPVAWLPSCICAWDIPCRPGGVPFSGWPTSSCAPSSWSVPGASGAPRASTSATVRPRASSCSLPRSLPPSGIFIAICCSSWR